MYGGCSEYGVYAAYGVSPGAETESRGDGLRPAFAAACNSSISSPPLSPGSSVVYLFGRLFLHLLIPKPTPTKASKATSMIIITNRGAITSCRTLCSGQRAPEEQLNGSLEPDGQNVPLGHGICCLPLGAPGQ